MLLMLPSLTTSCQHCGTNRCICAMSGRQDSLHGPCDQLTEIYVITNLVNGKKYVGKANEYKRCGRKHGTHARYLAHLYEAETGAIGCTYLNNAINKYGRASFVVKTIDTVPTTEQDYWESWYIKLHNTYEGPGYNLTAGGQARLVNPSEQNRQNQSASRRKYDPDLPMYVKEVRHISGQTGYAVYNPETMKTRSFMSSKLTMEEKRQLAIAWKAEAAASDLVASCSNPKHLPPFIQQRKSQTGLYVLYKVSRPGQTPKTVFYQSFKDGTFEQQLKAAKICLYQQIQKGVIKPSKAARTKLGLPGE